MLWYSDHYFFKLSITYAQTKTSKCHLTHKHQPLMCIGGILYTKRDQWKAFPNPTHIKKFSTQNVNVLLMTSSVDVYHTEDESSIILY